MKIAMLNCLKANEVCTGAGCMKAFNARTRHFEGYGPDTELIAMARCNGCQAGINTGFCEKLERLVKEGVEIVHVGVCTLDHETKAECPTITQAAQWLEDHGIRIVRGTH